MTSKIIRPTFRLSALINQYDLLIKYAMAHVLSRIPYEPIFPLYQEYAKASFPNM